MKIQSLLLFTISILLTFTYVSCDDLKDIDDTTTQTPQEPDSSEDPEKPTDPEKPEDPAEPDQPETPTCVAIGSISDVGTYAVQGTVVAVGLQAYVIADDSGAILIYDTSHDRKMNELVTVNGDVSRYNYYDTNVLQFTSPTVEVVSENSSITSNPTYLDADSFDALVGSTPADCIEIEFEGELTIDRSYVNVQVDGADRKASFKYITASDYNHLAGKRVVVKAYVVGTYNWLYMLPYSVMEVVDDGGGDREDGTVAISTITREGTYTVKGTVVATGKQAYIVADKTGALMVYGYNHNRTVGDVIKATGKVSRYQGYINNVLQMQNTEVNLISTGESWAYSPTPITDTALDEMINGKADCYEVVVDGWLSGDSVAVGNAANKAQLSYVDSNVYSGYNGKYVTVKGYITGTYQALKILPYSIEADGDVVPPSSTPSDNDPTTKRWMELPAMDDNALDYYYHSFSLSGKTYRNYSFGWDNTSKVAIWVAYPLCDFYTKSYTGKNVRHEEYFIKDPLLGDESPRPGSGYAGAYDRGHQIPSADRQCCELANGQTYYGTNITAQSQPLNGGPWAQLEGALRNFAKANSDTTYVVTGCYVEDSIEWETDSDDMRIKVPTAYFKAVLVLKNGTWTGGAYWTPHVGYASSYISWTTSIDWLEQKTGLDLFVNLSAKIGQSAADAIEAATPGSSKWWN